MQLPKVKVSNPAIRSRASAGAFSRYNSRETESSNPCDCRMTALLIFGGGLVLDPAGLRIDTPAVNRVGGALEEVRSDERLSEARDCSIDSSLIQGVVENFHAS